LNGWKGTDPEIRALHVVRPLLLTTTGGVPTPGGPAATAPPTLVERLMLSLIEKFAESSARHGFLLKFSGTA